MSKGSVKGGQDHLYWELENVPDVVAITLSEEGVMKAIEFLLCKHGKMGRLLVLLNNFTVLWYLPNLDIIDISNNGIGAVIPNGFGGSLNFGIENTKALAQLFLVDNKLSSDLLPEIIGVLALVSIDLSNNHFSGEIPATIGDLKKLDSFHLSNNKFSGSISDLLGSCVSFSDINIAHNSLTEKIPTSLESLPTLTSLNVSGNKLSGQIPETLSSLKLNLVDFSNNLKEKDKK